MKISSFVFSLYVVTAGIFIFFYVLLRFPLDKWVIKQLKDEVLKSSTPAGQSRYKYDCHVCGKSFRTDKLCDHYISKVIWNKNEIPVPVYSDTFRLATTDKKSHTKYFLNNNYSKK